MYAIIRSGDKQYRVAEGDVVKVERLPVNPGDKIELLDVLMLAGGPKKARVGKPRVEGAVVSAEVVREGRYRKVDVFKMKRRTGYRRRAGHRQYFTELRITGIAGPGIA